ncbi:hypothetical protein DCC85_00935 [Paenibacillus sp. CAA11]|uniref:PdaC/SigV domain-containing protein n=1 Tax=Paenibacillus sp. CAA11 TaxID=1532905 RepID=UPI000D3512C8|nr:DUF4163 domain-containing protein [Paenibacillus sp. CAA11]AWB42932.1 hypothetical protein DCC85_00935 [Paenibacillus sp. CAA11]
MKLYRSAASAVLSASLLLGASALPALPAWAAPVAPVTKGQPSVALSLNGQLLSQKGSIAEEGTLIPLSVIRDGLGLKISYEAKTKSYAIQRGTTIVRLTPGPSNWADTSVNGAKQIEGYLWVNNKGLNSVSVRVLSDHLGYRTEWNNSTKTVNLIPLKTNAVTVTAGTLSESSKTIDISIQYPQISGLTDAKVQSSMNQQFKDQAEAYLKDVKKRAAELGPAQNGFKNEVKESYSVTYNQNGIISFRTQSYEYYGGAHGMSVLGGLTFNLKSGQSLSLKDLLKSNPDYAKVLSAKVKTKLEKEPGYFGGFKTLGANPDFYLKDEGIVIFFQQYDYVPYAAGLLEYYFPFASLLPQGANPFEQ